LGACATLFITLVGNFDVFLLVTGVLQVPKVVRVLINCAVKSHSDEWPQEQIMILTVAEATMTGSYQISFINLPL